MYDFLDSTQFWKLTENWENSFKFAKGGTSWLQRFYFPKKTWCQTRLFIQLLKNNFGHFIVEKAKINVSNFGKKFPQIYTEKSVESKISYMVPPSIFFDVRYSFLHFWFQQVSVKFTKCLSSTFLHFEIWFLLFRAGQRRP